MSGHRCANSVRYVAERRRAVYGREEARHRAVDAALSFTAGLIIVGAALALVCGAILLAGGRPARAHGPAEWIQNGAFKNSAGELCCGERDCGEMIGGKVVATPQGYRVDAYFRIIPPSGPPIIDEVHETVPYSEATPSPDGVYWRCRWGGMRKCFFAPPPNT